MYLNHFGLQEAPFGLAPHTGFYSEESYYQLKRRTMQNVIDVLKGRECHNIVVPRPQ